MNIEEMTPENWSLGFFLRSLWLALAVVDLSLSLSLSLKSYVYYDSIDGLPSSRS